MKKHFVRISFIAVLAVILTSSALLAGCGKNASVQNSSFDKLGSNNLPVGWTFTSYRNDITLSNATVVKEDGVNVVCITNKTDDDAHFFQKVSVKPNTVYRFSVMCRTENVTGTVGANIGLEDVICHSEPLIGTNDWTMLELVGKTDAAQKELGIGCRLGNFGAESSGVAYFKDFRVETLSSYTGVPKSFSSGSSSSSSSSSDDSEIDPAQLKARMVEAIFTITVFLLVPLAIAFITWYEHYKEKKSGLPPVKSPAQLEESIFKVNPDLPKPTDTKLHYTRRDWIYVCVLTAIYAVLAVTNLGSIKFPQNEWKGRVGTAVTFNFNGTAEIAEIWQNGGITGGTNGDTTYTLTADDGRSVDATQKFGIMYRWNKLSVGSPLKTTTLTLTVTKGEAWLNELAFIDPNGKPIPVSVTEEKDLALVDEQQTIPEYPDYMNGMYFDELYHARTAYENVHNLKVYEVSHPPLGKIIISLGVRIFGMTPFGWRIMGAVFGILMIPLMYAFGKRFFKRPELALLTAALMAFDFMHYAQTRIATIDSYGVFFNLLMTYYMYKFIKMDLGDSLKDTLVPLGLSGLFFGLGCASKWICIYTGAALAVMFFTKMILLGIKSHKIKAAKLTDGQKQEPAYKNALNYPKRLVKTLLFCIVMFIIVPGAIYVASYFPYYTSQWKTEAENAKIVQMRASGELPRDAEAPADVLTLGEKAKAYINGVIKNNLYMYKYHSGLTSTHPYESRWFEWPLSNRPMWFYAGYNVPDKTMYGTISSFGNPAVWWICFAGMVYFLILTLRGRFKVNTEVFFILLCLTSSMLPWLLITRSVYIYHYFATVPTIIFASVYVLKHYEDKYYYVPAEMKSNGDVSVKPRKGFTYIKYVWIAIAVILFAVFYPVITGIPVKKTYIEALQWLPTWTFTGVWPSIWAK